MRRLVVNGDDFGLSAGVNRGIIKAHRHGILTSASLMVHGDDAQAGAAMAADHPDLSLGIHLDLGEWKFDGREWIAVYERAPLQDADLLEAEVDAQLRLFERLVGRRPTHLDSHQHAHKNEPLRSIVSRRGEILDVPVRHVTAGIRYLGDFYGQDDRGEPYNERVSVEFLKSLIEQLPEGTTELCCHPADEVDFGGTYAAERVAELATLCSPAAAIALAHAGVALESFSSIARDSL
jgi:predicted glycoside hydrolase/deacetylase ChbG (UPF0249 family)